MIKQFCVNECGRATDGKTNVCCATCLPNYHPHTPECDVRHGVKAIASERLTYCRNCGALSDYCARLPLRCCTDCDHAAASISARKAAAYDRLMEQATACLANVYSELTDYGKSSGDRVNATLSSIRMTKAAIAALDAEVRG